MAKVLRGVFPFSGGEYRIDGEKIEHFSEEYLSEFFGLLPQHILFVPGTIVENISGMQPDPDPKAVIAAARKAKTHRFIKNLPNAYATVIDLEGSRFSEGQRRQIALARALYAKPRILIIDDLDGALARAYGGDMQPLIDHVCKPGGSVIFFTREPKRLKIANLHLMLENGRVAFSKEHAVTPIDGKAAGNVSEFALPK